MKRYLIFAYDTYYPSGGLDDIQDAGDTIEEARKKAKRLKIGYEIVEIFDRLEGVTEEIN